VPAPLDPRVHDVLAAFGLETAGATVEPAPSGLIQSTYLTKLAGGRRVVVQRMHPIFAPEVVEDIDAVTAHLAARGLETPRPLRTPSGTLTVTDDEGRSWRILSFVEGHTVDRVDRPARAFEAGRLVARFHRAMAGWDRPFRFQRAGVHDTAAHLGRLAGALAGATAETEALRPIAEAILDEARRLPPLAPLPRRVTHGDLKISNVLFAGDAEARARALIDLDTLGRLTIAYELGDAWRSWCNPLGEDVADTHFDLEILAAAAAGYGEAHDLDRAEAESLVAGVLTVCLELAARFCVDAFEDRYFGWDASRFPSRREHNRVRALGQLQLARQVAASRARAEQAVAQVLRPQVSSRPG
jgi:Ser/Thr protein kinase RdoA (MazF antagonist)